MCGVARFKAAVPEGPWRLGVCSHVFTSTDLLCSSVGFTAVTAVAPNALKGSGSVVTIESPRLAATRTRIGSIAARCCSSAKQLNIRWFISIVGAGVTTRRLVYREVTR